MTIYRKGARKEYEIIKRLRKKGFCIAQRTAGSHSPIDIFAIDRQNKVIKFIQSKRTLSKNMMEIDEKLKKKLEKEFYWLNGLWLIQFEAL